jgi:stearoyl-CoA desaturase (delta-9 desaturase)
VDISLRTIGWGSRLWRFGRQVGDNVYKGAFVAIHLSALLAFFIELTDSALVLGVSLYFLRMFGITAGYHRYFAHRSYKTSRWFQFLLALLGCSAAQRGPLWWAANHRAHHRCSDTGEDPHSPLRGFCWAHVTWILHQSPSAPGPAHIRDWARYPELRWLDRFQWVPPSCLLVLCYVIAGWSGLVWGFVVGTVLLYHATFLVNSVCHIAGTRRYSTPDGSKNNAVVALLTMGEGWHNNHHHCPHSAKQGFRWWEIDLCYCALCGLALFGLVWNLRKPPLHKLTPAARAPRPTSAQNGFGEGGGS